MKKHGKLFSPLLLAVLLVLFISSIAFAQNGTIIKRETVDPSNEGYARWIKITVKGASPGNDLDDDFEGMQMLVDLNLDQDNDYTTPADPPRSIGKDSYYAISDSGDIVTSPVGGGDNDSLFFVRIKEGRENHYPLNADGYETSLRPRIQLTNSGALRVGKKPSFTITVPIGIESDLYVADDGIKPVIRAAYFYDDGSGGTAATANHKGNMTAFDGYIDRIDLQWSEKMSTANTAVPNTMFTGLGSSIWGFQSIGVWDNTPYTQADPDSARRFTLYLLSSQPNTGITPNLTYNLPASTSDRFKEGTTSQYKSTAEVQSRLVTDKAGPAIISAKTKRASRRQLLASALTSKRIEVTFSEPVKLSEVQTGVTDFEVKTTATGEGSNNITSIISPASPTTSSATYEFQLTTNFASENEVGTIQFTADSAVTDVLSNRNGVSHALQPPTRPTPSRGLLITIIDGIDPNIIQVSTVDAVLPEQLPSGGTNGWGYLDYIEVTFDHNMSDSRVSSAGFSVSGTGIQSIGGTGTWTSATTFRIPLVATSPSIANTSLIPTVSYANPGNPNGLIAANSYLAENLLTTDTATSSSNGLAVQIIDLAGPAIIQAYTAGQKRIRLAFSEKVNTAGWPIEQASAEDVRRFAWFVGSILYNGTGTKIFFTGLSSSRKDSVIYLNHTGTAWAKTDEGAINFSNDIPVYDLAASPNINKQYDHNNSINSKTEAIAGFDVKVNRDNIAPILTKLETVDLDKNGKLDHYRFVFDPLSPIFPRPPGHLFNPSLWSIKGYDTVAKSGLQVDLTIYNPVNYPDYPRQAINSFGDTVEVFIKFTETSGTGPSSTPYGGDTGDVPDVVVADGNGFRDWADNVMSALPTGITLEKDKAGPAIISAKTINTTQVEVLMSEDLLDGYTSTADLRLNMGKDLSLLDVQEVSPGKLKAIAFDQDYWLPTQTGNIALVSPNVVYDNITGEDNSNRQTGNIPVNDRAASQFDINLAIEGNVIRGVPFQIEVVARDSHGNLDINFPEKIVFSSNLTQNEIDLPDGPQPLTGGMAYFNVTSWKTTENLIISVSVNSDRYARFFSNSDPIEVVEPVIDAPNTLKVKDYRGIDGNGDQGGYVALIFDYSTNHPGIGTENVIDYYEIYREFDHDVWNWGTFQASDTTGTHADSMRLVVWTGDSAESIFWVRAVWNPSWPGTSNGSAATEAIALPKGYTLMSGNVPILLRSKGKKVKSLLPKQSATEAGSDQVVSASIMAQGRAIDNIAPKSPANLYADKAGVAVKLHWPKVTQGVNGLTELFPIKYEVLSHATNAYFDPAQGTVEATVSDTSYQVNSESLRKFFCVRAVDSDNKSEVSKRTGKWGFQMALGSANKYNYLSLPLETSKYKKASDLSTDITGLAALLQLEATTNAYSKFYLPAISFGTNFTLKSGIPVLVSAGPTAASSWFYTGPVPTAQSVQFTLVKRADKNMYNEIILPLDKTGITTADQLAKNIGGVEIVLKLDPVTNAFTKFWLPAIQYGDNFAIQPGEPVLISVNNTAPSVWPIY
jgi:hypothetical protein